MGLLQAILDGKAMAVERARAAAQGEAQGREAEARKVLRLLLRKHFPELESLAQIDAIASVVALESIIEWVLDGTGADAVRTAILTAAQPNWIPDLLDHELIMFHSPGVQERPQTLLADPSVNR